MQCNYDLPWYGQCKNKAVKGSKNCKEHDILCSVCGERLATHGCNHASSLSCGFPLCDKKECEDKHQKKHGW